MTTQNPPILPLTQTPQPTSTGPSIPPTSTGNPVKRICQIVGLKASSYEEYKKCHANVWPEVLAQIHECHIYDYSIFLSPQNTLIATFKWNGENWERDMELMRSNEKVREWWAMTDGMQESFVSGALGSAEGPGWWVGCEEVFYEA